MKVLIYSTSSNNVHTVLDSLRFLEQHEVVVFHYDKKYLETVAQVLQTTPDLRDAILTRQWPAKDTSERAGWLKRVSSDQQMLDAAKYAEPDVILYISAWEGDFVPSDETLGELNTIAPLVHLCFDGADSPWWPQMKRFEDKGIFRLTVTIDGALFWPGGIQWLDGAKFATAFPDEKYWRVKNALSLLTPCDPRAFEGPIIPFMQRPFAVSYAGNAGGWLRGHLVNTLSRHKGHVFTFRPRDNANDSYRGYAEFLRQSKCVISVPFTGSTQHAHVKGRPVECGWAGAALLEWRNEVMREWFVPRAEYWEYDSVETCLEETEYLAGHPRLCEEMAKALRYRVTTEHHPAKFWAQVLAAI